MAAEEPHGATHCWDSGTFYVVVHLSIDLQRHMLIHDVGNALRDVVPRLRSQRIASRQPNASSGSTNGTGEPATVYPRPEPATRAKQACLVG